MGETSSEARMPSDVRPSGTCRAYGTGGRPRKIDCRKVGPPTPVHRLYLPSMPAVLAGPARGARGV